MLLARILRANALGKLIDEHATNYDGSIEELLGTEYNRRSLNTVSLTINSCYWVALSSLGCLRVAAVHASLKRDAATTHRV